MGIYFILPSKKKREKEKKISLNAFLSMIDHTCVRQDVQCNQRYSLEEREREREKMVEPNKECT